MYTDGKYYKNYEREWLYDNAFIMVYALNKLERKKYDNKNAITPFNK